MTFRGQMLLITICTALMAPLRAGTVLTFDVATHSTPPPGAKAGQPTPKDRNFTQIVALSGDVLQIEEPDSITRYDFKRARIIRLDSEKKEYEERSLYVVLGFNVLEFDNRMKLGRILAAGKPKTNPMLPALTENLMSLQDPANATVIETSAKGGDTAFSADKQLLMKTSLKVQALPPDEVRQYLRFLRYAVGGHPKILEALGHGAGVPERLGIVRTNIDTETRTLTLRRVDERADAEEPSLEGYTRSAPPREPFTTLALSSMSAADVESHARTLRQERDAALSAGQLLDALLANMAAMLSSGDYAEATAWTAAHHEALNTSEEVKRLFASLQPTNEASAKQALQTLQELRASQVPHAYVLSIFEANTRLGFHQNAEAEQLFLSALRADASITGAWIDLGTVYLNTFEADAAWACWDAARALRPGHPMLKVVNERELKLRSEHPEFF
jgi:hypothetical protein